MKQYPSRMGIGASSILLILVIVSLTLFASLSLIQARADAALTQKTAVSTAAYYEADARAQQTIALLDDALQEGVSPETVEGVLLQEDQTAAFAIEASDGHVLRVIADISSGRCIIQSYRYESAEGWAQESAGTLWQGG
jgi:type II secretory pathway component PulJ